MRLIWLAFGGSVSVGIELYEGIELPDICHRMQSQSQCLESRSGESVNDPEAEVAHDPQPLDS
jgi:hypothetical protein